MRYVRWLLLSVLFFLLLMLGVVWFLLGTNTGLNIGLSFVPGLQVGQSHGSLLGGLQLRQVRFQQTGVNAQVQAVKLAWRPWQLLQRKAHVSQLQVNGALVALSPQAETEAPPSEPLERLPDIELPVQIVLDDVQLNDVELAVLEPAEGETKQQIKLRQLHLSAQSAEGHFSLHDFKLRDLQVDDLLQLQQAHLKADFALLAPHRLQVKSLLLQGVEVTPQAQDAALQQTQKTSPTPTAASQSISLPDIQLPLEIAVDEAWLREWRLNLPGNPVFLQALRLALHTQDGRLHVDDLSVQQLHAQDAEISQAQLSAQLALQAPHTVQVKLGADARHPQAGEVRLQVQAQGDPQALTMEAQVQVANAASSQQDAPIQLSVTANAQDLLADLRWQAKIYLQGVDSHHSSLRALLKNAPRIQADTDIQARGDVKNAQAFVQLHTQVEAFGAFSLQLSMENLRENWQQWRLQELALRQAGTALELDVQGDIDLRQAQPQVDASIGWRGVRWPLQGGEMLAASRKGKLKFTGSPDAYQVTLEAQLQAQNAPDSRWTLQATGNTQAASIDHLRGELLNGWLQLSGDVGWQPQPVWDLRLDSQNIDPAQQWQDFPGKLALTLRSVGQLHGANVKARVEGLQLKGRLREYPLHLLVDAAIDGKDYKIQQLHLQSGKTQMQVKGAIEGEKVGLDWQITAPRLQELYPHAQGSLSGAGKVGGLLTRPTVQAALQARSLVFADNRLKHLDLTAKVDVNPQGNMDLDLNAKGLQAGGAVVDSLNLQAKGAIAAHTVKLAARLRPQAERDNAISAELGLKGGLQNMNAWQGALQSLTLRDAQWGSLSLKQPVALQASAQKAALEQACLALRVQGKASQLCLQAAWQAVKGGMGAATAKLKLDELSLDLLKPFLPDTMQLQNFATSLQLDAELLKNGDIRSDLVLNLTPGQVRLVNPNSGKGTPLTLLKHQGTQLTASINQQGLNAKLNMQLPQQDGIQASIRLPNLKRLPLSDNQPLDGEIKLQFTDFSLLPVFAPQVADPKGRIEADIKLAGQMTQPIIEGELHMRDGGVQVPLAGLTVHDVQLAVKGDQAGKVKLNGQLRMGEQSRGDVGLLRLNGDLTAAADWSADLKVKGKRLEVMNSPEIWLLASPDLHFEGSHKRMTLKGEISVPQALITPPEAQGGGKVSASSDVVVIAEDKDAPAPKDAPAEAPTLPFYTDLRLLLGEQVQVKGMGFKGRLQGDLRVSGKPDKGLVGNGRISVLDGRYKAYGQDLRIRKGNVLYSGGPVENPGLDVQAVRVVGDVTAGIEVSGTAQQPELNLFSEPALDQTNILSYIVLGRPASSGNAASGDQQRMLAQALSDLALNEDSTVAKTLRDDLGLDSAGIDTSGGAEQTTFMLGKYLTPDLYISYGVGLFDAENVFRMRYRLSRRFSLESATSGGNSGVDLRYTLER